MDLPTGPIVEAFSRAEEKSEAEFTSFLKLPPVKAFYFYLAVGLGIGITVSPSQNNNCLTPIPPVYTLRYENLFRLNLQERNTKAVKDENAEVVTAIWNNTDAEMFQGVYMAKRHEPLFQHLSNIVDKSFKHNTARSFVCNFVESCGSSRSVWHGDISKYGDKDREAILEIID